MARIGGDEFTVLVPELPQEEGAAEVSRKILRELERAFQVGGSEYAVRASIGIALYPRDGETSDALLRSADAAMYRRKGSRRQSVRLARALRAPADTRAAPGVGSRP